MSRSWGMPLACPQNRHWGKPEAWSRPSILQRKCACGGECESCRKKEQLLQRQAAPPIVEDVLRSPGMPLDHSTRAFMESRFNHDFSGVRVHTDSRAAESARAVDAFAYTVGQDIVFASQQYGSSLLAHELTHVVQQSQGPGGSGMSSADAAEHEAEHAGRSIEAGIAAPIRSFGAAGIQRQGKNPLDEKAKAIIARAKDASKSIDQRAIQAVKDIVSEYYDSSKLSEVVYEEGEPGVSTTPVGKGAAIKGKLFVGKYFIEHIDDFARRVLQVGHEMQHVDQQRAGMGGEADKDKREFKAFTWEALAEEKPGTGRVSHATRRDLIDAALGYYYCLSEDEQKASASDKEKLLKQREIENKKGGNEPTDPPTSCKRQASAKKAKP